MESFCLCALLCLLFHYVVDNTFYTLPFYQVDELDGAGYCCLCICRIDRYDGSAHCGEGAQEEIGETRKDGGTEGKQERT